MEGMNSEAAVHPDAEQLQGFSRGVLPPTEAIGRSGKESGNRNQESGGSGREPAVVCIS